MKNGSASSPLFASLLHRRLTTGARAAVQQRGLSTGSLLSCVALIAALGGGAWWWTHREVAPGADGTAAPAGAAGAAGRRFGGASRVQPVTVAAVQQRDINVTINAIGNMAALNTAIVRTKVDGELKAIRFKEGQQVKAGQVLAEIDARAYEAALAQMQGQLVRDQAQLRNAQLDLERYADLLRKDSIAKQQVDTQDALVKQLQGTVQTDQAQVDNAKLQLSYTQVTAPISGRLGLKQTDLGSVVHASDATGLVSITQTQPIALVFAVPEANLAQITRKLKGKDAAKDVLAVEAWDREQRNLVGKGRVITTDNAIDAATGTIKLKAEFANADGGLFPNQFVNVRLQLETLTGVTAVPSNAVQRGAQGTFVYVLKDDNTVSMRRIRLGATEGDWVSVQGELAAGDKVVTDGADRLREGAKVEVITPVAPTAPGRPKEAGVKRAEAANPTAAHQTAAHKPAADQPPADAAPAGERPAGAPAPRADGMPPWFDRLSPEMQEKFKKMNPDERKEFTEKMRERRRQREAEGG